MIAYIPLIIALVGLLLYMWPTKNPKINRVGEIMFFCGVFAFALATAGKMTRLL